MNRCERLEDAVGGAVFHWLDEDAITVIVVDDEDVIVAAVGHDYESAGLFGVDLTGDWVGLDDIGVTLMCSSVVGIAEREHVGGVVCDAVTVLGRWCHGLWLGGALIFAGLVHVPLNHGDGLGGCFASEAEVRPGKLGR